MTVKILCVDPSEEDRDTLRRALAPYDVRCVGSAFDAIREMNASGPFDVYVLEYWLPDLAGHRLCRDIRKTDPRVPIVVCTTAERDEDRARALRAGANAYYVKPIAPSELRRKVQTLIEFVDIESRHAQAAEMLAIADELRGQSKRLRERVEIAKDQARAAMERLARVKALQAFVENGGTLGSFERLWPEGFEREFLNMWSASRGDDGSRA